MEFSADAPETWRVGFRCFMDRRRRAGQHRRLPARTPAVHSDAARFHSAWPLAERAEALLRVFNDPLPYAKRLARRLYATPHRTRALMRYEAETPSLVGAVAFGTVGAAAGEACASFDTS